MVKNRAFSILELVLVMGLLSLLVVLVAAFFSKAQHYTTDAETYSRVQRQTNIALRRITDEVQSGTSAFQQYRNDLVIFLSSTPNSPSEPTMEFDNATGQIIWKKWVCFYYDAPNRTIVRVEQPLVTPTSQLHTSPDPPVEPDFFTNTNNGVRRIIAKDVEDFFVLGTTNSYVFRVTCRSISPVPGRLPDDKIVEVSAETEINLLN